MSGFEGEFKLSEPGFIIKAGLFVDEVVDDVQDVHWQTEGKLVAQNSGEALCSGGQTIGCCETSKTMAALLLHNAYGMPLHNPIDGVDIMYMPPSKGNKHTVKMACVDCAHNCQASLRKYETHTQEKIRFLFEDPNAKPAETPKVKFDNHDAPIIVTSFDIPYFKGQT